MVKLVIVIYTLVDFKGYIQLQQKFPKKQLFYLLHVRFPEQP